MTCYYNAASRTTLRRLLLRGATSLCLTAAVLGCTLVPTLAAETAVGQEKAPREEALLARSGQAPLLTADGEDALEPETQGILLLPPADGETAVEAPPAGEVSPEQEAHWSLRLINWQKPLETDFAPPALTSLSGGHQVDARIAEALQAMLADAKKEGLHPLICSSYRQSSKQTQLFQRKVRYYQSLGYGRTGAEDKASFWVARPGTSEHEAGLAVDIISTEYRILNQKQEDTAVQRWLMAHCADYGFVLRYPSDKSDITHVGYEPWHYRYVGKEAAREMTDRGLCLEEYLAERAALLPDVPLTELTPAMPLL